MVYLLTLIGKKFGMTIKYNGIKSYTLAPFFCLLSTNNKEYCLKHSKGKIVILYFYPKDDTPGCTKEAIEFSDNSDFFIKNSIIIIGISKDTVEKHDKFIIKHNLKVILGSDISGEICDNFGVWIEKSMYGKKYMGIERSTFLISKNNKIHKIWRKVRVKGHVDEVILASKRLLNI